MFYENLTELCEKNGLSLTNLITDKLHMSSGNITRWKNGTTPNSKILTRIADYFNVTTDYLLTGSDNKKSPEKSEDEVPKEFKLLARKMDGVPDAQRKRIYKILDSTIDNVLEALKDEDSANKH